MKLSLEKKDYSKVKSEAVVLGVFEKFSFPKDPFCKTIEEEAKKVRFDGNVGESFYLKGTHFDGKIVLVLGLGKEDEYSIEKIRVALSSAVRKLKERYIESAVFAIHPEKSKDDFKETISTIAEVIVLTNRKFDRYITDRKKLFFGLNEAIIVVKELNKKAEEGIKKGKTLSESVVFARDLITLPSNEVTPTYLAEEAMSIAKAYNFKAKILDEKECRKLNMNAFLTVAQGSKNQPKFIHLTYQSENSKKRIGIIGKGLTFDSGGLSLKPAQGMGAMKSDMSGAAAVLATMKAIGELKPEVNVEMIIAACENMPSGKAYRPGDVIYSMSGKSIEVQNTDAEGRLTLADAITYTQKQKVDEIIDLATLTGACMIALGTDIAGIMGNDQTLIDSLISISKKTGDSLWQLPLEEGYFRFIKSPIADICNNSSVRWGGAITAGLFLKFFVDKKVKWAHIDIAGPAYRDDDLNENHKAEGAGFGVRLLINHLLKQK